MAFSDRQNEFEAHRLLVAATKYYENAKTLRACEALFVVLLPCVVSVFAAFNHAVDLLAALSGFVLTLADAIIYPISNRRRLFGAQVQERFDSRVLGLPLMQSRIEGGPDMDEIYGVTRGLTEAAIPSRFRDWYTPILAELPHPLDRLACQRENNVWDGDLRAVYRNTLIGLALIISTALFVIFALRGLTVERLVIAFLFPLLPAYVWVIHEIADQKAAIDGRRALRNLGNRLWDDFLVGRIAEAELQQGIEDLQSGIFAFRSTAAPVPQVLYRMLWRQYASQMTTSANAIVQSAKAALSTRK